MRSMGVANMIAHLFESAISPAEFHDSQYVQTTEIYPSFFDEDNFIFLKRFAFCLHPSSNVNMQQLV